MLLINGPEISPKISTVELGPTADHLTDSIIDTFAGVIVCNLSSVSHNTLFYEEDLAPNLYYY